MNSFIDYIVRVCTFAVKSFKAFWTIILNQMPTVLLFISVNTMLSVGIFEGLLVWIISELIQIKYSLEHAEIIVREEE